MNSLILWVYFWINLLILIVLFVDMMMGNSNMEQKITMKTVGKVLSIMLFGVFIVGYQMLRKK